MQSLISSSSIQSEIKKNFVIKRIDEEDIKISNGERMIILKALNAGVRFVQVRDYTLMINSIKSIEPFTDRWYPSFDNYAPESLPPAYTEEEQKQRIANMEKTKAIFKGKIVDDEGGDSK